MNANQPYLRRVLADLPWQHVPAHRATERSHGRTATRIINAVDAPELLESPGADRSSRCAAPVTRHGKRSVEIVHLIRSRTMIPKRPSHVSAPGCAATGPSRPASSTSAM